MPRLLLPALAAASLAGITLCLLDGSTSVGHLDLGAERGVLSLRWRTGPDSVCFSDYTLGSEGSFQWWLRDDAFAPTTLRAFHVHCFEDHWYLAAALAPPTVLTTVAASYLTMTRILRPPRLPHLCPTCRYDRSGLRPERPCPECGHTLTPRPNPLPERP